MARRWAGLVGVTPLLLGMMVAVPQMVVAPLVLAQGSSQSSQQTEAQQLYNEGVRLWRLLRDGQSVDQVFGYLRQALANFQQALPLFRANGDRNGEADSLASIGRIYSTFRRDQQQTLSYFQQALTIYREIGNRNGEAQTLNGIGLMYVNNQDFQLQQVLTYFQQALTIYREIGDRNGEAATLENIASLYTEVSQPQQALSFYEQALPIWREVGDRRREAITLDIIGKMYLDMPRPPLQRVLDYFQQSLTIWEDLDNRPREAEALHNISRVYDRLGEVQKAIDYYNQSVRVRLEIESSR